MSRIDYQRVYPHPPDRVWRALTEPDLLAAWLMPNDFEPRVGHEFTFRTDPAPGFDGIVRCRVLDLEDERLLRFSWKGGPLDTVATFRLEPVAGGTRLTFEHTGFSGLRQWIIRSILKAGFGNMYRRKLPAVLATIDGTPDGPLVEPAACAGPLHRLRVSVIERINKGRTP